MAEQKAQKMSNKVYMPLIRRGIQILCFIFIPSLFIQIFNSIKAVIFLLIHQQSTVSVVLPDIVLLAAVTVVTLIAGRFFCGWMCAFGSMGDFIYRFPRFIFGKKNTRNRIPRTIDVILKGVKYILFALFVIMIWGFELVSIPQGTDPWAVFGMLASFGNWPSLTTLVQGWMIATFILMAIIIASFFWERFFCRYLCPLGAYFAIISRLRPVNIRKDRKNCGKCRLCTVKCSMGIPLDNMDQVTTGECINCMECVRVCPSSNAHLDLDEKKKNVIVAGTLSCALISGAYYLGNLYDTMQPAETTVAGTQTSNSSYSNLADGIYTGSGMGFRGETTVEVTLESGVITNVDITAASDDAEYLNKASGTIISEVIAGQTTDVDTVSGATYSSNGIISAIANALSNNNQTETGSRQDTASVSASAGQSLETDTQQEAASTQADSALQATASSSADASDTQLQDGTYNGSGTGFRGETDVTVTVAGGKITDIRIDSYQDDEQFFGRAESTIIQEIIDNQSVNVDAVSGATYSSNGIKEAVANALSLDYTSSAVQSKGRGGFRHE